MGEKNESMPARNTSTAVRRSWRRYRQQDASHVLEFYMPDNDVDEGEELLSVSHAKRRSVASYLSSFEYLVSLEEARVYVLRALLGGIILEDFE